MGTELSFAKTLMGAKLETAKGTYETIASAECNFRPFDLEITPNISPDNETYRYLTGSHAEDTCLFGQRLFTIKFKHRCNWGGAVATEPEWWTFAKACGCGVINYTTVGRGLVGRSAYDDTTISFLVQHTEVGTSGGPVSAQYTFAGAMGEMTIGAGKNGDPWVAEFEFQAKLNTAADGTALALTAPSTVLGEMFLSNTLTIDSVTPKISSFQFKTGNKLSAVPNQADGAGISHFIVAERSPRFSCNRLASKLATHNWYSDLNTPNLGVISLASAASSPHFTLKVVNAQPMPPSITNKDGLIAYDMNYRACMNGIPGTLIDSTLTHEDTWELLQGSRT